MQQPLGARRIPEGAVTVAALADEPGDTTNMANTNIYIQEKKLMPVMTHT